MILNTKKRVLILGANGYIGCALYNYLKSIKKITKTTEKVTGTEEVIEEEVYEVLGVDNEMRERNVIEVGSNSITPNRKPWDINLDISLDYNGLKEIISSYKPDVIINLAQQPSAPFSMRDAKSATESQRNNIVGGLNVLWVVKEINPEIHVIQLGTAGEYPDWLYEGVEIPEGSRINVKYQDKDWTIPTPRYAGSWYHFSKLHASYNADYACRIWGLRVTDINQGIVYGINDNTRLDYDEYFGTVINRFVAQAVIGVPLTVYGEGGQTRSFIHLSNSIQAIELLVNNPPKLGEYRIIQQLTDVKNIWQIAEMVQNITGCEIQKIENPRMEMVANEFRFEASKLKTLGLVPVEMETEIRHMVDVVREYKDNIKKEVILPKTKWK